MLTELRRIDTGADKKKLCLELGAEKWIDFKESKDIVKDVIEAADGVGAHAAIVTSASVSPTYYTSDIFFRG